MPLLFPTASKSKLDLGDIEVRLLRNTVEAKRYNKVANNLSKRRRLDCDYLDRNVYRGGVTLDVVSLPQEVREESADLDVWDFSTDIDE
jgi:hypothetical protein